MTGVPDTETVPERADEVRSIERLLLTYAAARDAETEAVAVLVAEACTRPGHLWREMGLESRADLRRLLEHHFPEFASGNDRDMRWKAYIYRRLCGWPGFDG